MGLMDEVWKSVLGFEGKYLVSSLGRVKGPRKTLKQSLAFGSGYMRVGLRSLNKKSVKHITVHRLVAMTFISNPENKKEVNHIDGNKLNNHASNLEWATTSENRVHAYKNKLIRARSTTFTDEQVLMIRLEYEDPKETLCSLSEKYGVSATSIGNIIKRKSYKYI